MNKQKNIDTLSINGGALSIDFTNTVDSRVSEHPFEYLADYQEFISWCQRMELKESERLDALADYALKHKREAAQALEKTIAVRENIFSLLLKIASGQTDTLAKDLQQFNEYLSESLSKVQLNLENDGFVDEWNQQKINLEEPLWVLVKATYELLTHENFNRIKQCHAPGCGWLFLDQTKNNKRRWCNPSTCGSMEKSKRYYRKKKKQRGD